MDELLSIVMSWQFVLAAIVVAFIMLGLGVIGEKLWSLKWKWLRATLRFLESVKVFFPPLIGFGLGWIPQLTPMEELQEANRLWFALLLMVAGSLWQYIYDGFKSQLKARGIDLSLDLTPKQQRRKQGK